MDHDGSISRCIRRATTGASPSRLPNLVESWMDHSLEYFNRKYPLPFTTLQVLKLWNHVAYWKFQETRVVLEKMGAEHLLFDLGMFSNKFGVQHGVFSTLFFSS